MNSMQKEKKWRCKKYTDWVKTLPSSLSIMPSDDPHHLIDVLFSGANNKPHDLLVMPLTRLEHSELHHKGSRKWEYDHDINQAEEVIKTIDKAISLGLIEIKWIG